MRGWRLRENKCIAWCYYAPPGLRISFCSHPADRTLRHIPRRRRPGRWNRSALESQTILVDCGSSQQKSIGEKVLVPYLKSQGDASGSCGHDPWGPGSHERDPVSSGTPGIRNRVGGLMMPEAGKMRSIWEDGGACKKAGCSCFYAQRGDIWNNFPGKGMSMECLSPDGGDGIHRPE